MAFLPTKTWSRRAVMGYRSLFPLSTPFPLLLFLGQGAAMGSPANTLGFGWLSLLVLREALVSRPGPPSPFPQRLLPLGSSPLLCHRCCLNWLRWRCRSPAIMATFAKPENALKRAEGTLSFHHALFSLLNSLLFSASVCSPDRNRRFAVEVRFLAS